MYYVVWSPSHNGSSKYITIISTMALISLMNFDLVQIELTVVPPNVNGNA